MGCKNCDRSAGRWPDEEECRCDLQDARAFVDEKQYFEGSDPWGKYQFWSSPGKPDKIGKNVTKFLKNDPVKGVEAMNFKEYVTDDAEDSLVIEEKLARSHGISHTTGRRMMNGNRLKRRRHRRRENHPLLPRSKKLRKLAPQPSQLLEMSAYHGFQSTDIDFNLQRKEFRDISEQAVSGPRGATGKHDQEEVSDWLFEQPANMYPSPGSNTAIQPQRFPSREVQRPVIHPSGVVRAGSDAQGHFNFLDNLAGPRAPISQFPQRGGQSPGYVETLRSHISHSSTSDNGNSRGNKPQVLPTTHPCHIVGTSAEYLQRISEKLAPTIGHSESASGLFDFAFESARQQAAFGIFEETSSGEDGERSNQEDFGIQTPAIESRTSTIINFPNSSVPLITRDDQDTVLDFNPQYAATIEIVDFGSAAAQPEESLHLC